MENTYIGPFQVLEKLGAHRRHHVYRARQTEQDREVALKFIKLPPHIDRDTALGKINREVAVVKKLEHPHLVQLYGAGVHEDQVFFAHELIEGETLASLLSRRGRLASDLVIDYGRQIASVLEFLHQNEIIHSKLTTDKLIIDADGQIHVTDLRLNRSRRRRWDAARRATLETAAYMPPEQLLGEGSSPKSDLYTLGIIMYEMLTGKLPFEPQTMAQLARDKKSATVPRVADTIMSCPAWLDKLVRKMILPDPKMRPHSARAVIMTLDQIRSVDQSQMAAAEEINRGFSALSAGADRTAARRALGLKNPKPEPENEVPILQNSLFLVGGLALIAMIFVAAIFWTRGGDYREQLAEANVLMESSDNGDWREARKIYRRIMEDSPDEELRLAAEEQYFESRRKSMMHRLRGGLAPLEKPAIRELYEIMQNEADYRMRAAKHQYQRLIDKIDPEDDLRYVRTEALARLEKIREIETEAADLRKRYEELVKLSRLPDASEEVTRELTSVKKKIVETQATRDFLEDLVEELKDEVNNDSAEPENDSGKAEQDSTESGDADSDQKADMPDDDESARSD